MKGFVQAYTQYGDTDPLYTNCLSKPVTSNGKYLAGLEKRRKAEWDLFHTGYYINTGSYYSVGSLASGNIVDNAKKCHDFLRTNGFTYAQAGQNIPVTSSSKKTIDCSSYVSWVLYESGFSQFAGYQKTSSYFASNPMNWEKVTKGNLQPGDIMVFTGQGHVQIYAGNGTYYNCGSNNSIKTPAPSGNGRTENDSGFLFGLRPNL